jgi:hypothetical protein
MIIPAEQSDYRKFANIEVYLFEEVGPQFRASGMLEPVDLFMIFIWKANRAKTKTKKALQKRANGSFPAATKKIAVALFQTTDRKERLAILMRNWGLRLPMAWPNPLVSGFGAGVYTIWRKDGRFIYVGMSGRGMTAETIRRNTPQGIYTRLKSHASGRRSGDQFCVYVADRLVLPTLAQEDIEAIVSGRHQMDGFVRRYIHEHLSYRFVVLPDGLAAYAVEAAIKSGEWEHGQPLLNPAR